MARKNRFPAYSWTCLVFLALAVVSLLTVNTVYLSGGEEQAVPSELFEGSLKIFGIIILFAKILPALLICAVIILPADLIKKYMLMSVLSLWLLFGEIAGTIIMLQHFEGAPTIWFYFSVLIAVAMFVCTLVFTKISTLPARHKELVWYKGLNKIITLASVPMASALTIALVLFADVFFNFEIQTIIGTAFIWVCLIFCAVISVFTLFEKYKTGLLYYVVAFLDVAGIVSLSISPHIETVLLGVVLASASGIFWLMMAQIVRKHY